MSLQTVQFRTAAADTAQVRSQLEKVFDALNAAAPRGVTYTAYASTSEPEFLLILDLADGIENPLLTLPDASRLRELITEVAGGPVPPRLCTVVGRYDAPR